MAHSLCGAGTDSGDELGAASPRHRPRSRRCPAALLLAAVGLLAGACAYPSAGQAFPDSNETRESALPPNVEAGLEVMSALGEGIGYVEREEWTDRLTRIGYRLAATADDSDTPYSFAVLDLDEPNALALPGGFVLVTRGIMQTDFSDDELAHVLGHEITHARGRHFERASRLNAVLSLARTALMIGVLMGVRETPSAAERVSVPQDPGLRGWSAGVSGKEALVEASALFGSVLQALFERGYSRNLEFEADEGGDRLAAQAGFAPEAGVSLLQKLHDRSYEGRRYSYWRTHPYFTERVARGRARAARLKAQDPPDDTAYRERLALTFASLAERVRDEKAALFLFERALRCEPSTLASLPAALELVRFKTRRTEQAHPLERGYRELIEGYDAVITEADRSDPGWIELPAARAERARLAHDSDQQLASLLQIVDGGAAPTDLLERFVENYPDHPRQREMTYRLGLHYSLSGRAELAVKRLAGLLKLEAGDAWADSAQVILLRTIPEMKDLTDCCRLLEDHAAGTDSVSVAIVRAARKRMDELVAADLSLEQGGRFLRNCPDAAHSAAIREKVLEKAHAAYVNARVHEGLQSYQEALDSYYAILAFAPDSPDAAQAQEAVTRIHRTETEP